MGSKRNKEIYTYEAPWVIYGLAWSVRSLPTTRFRLALGSFVEEYSNSVQIIEFAEDSQSFHCTGSFEHPYPPTKILWSPDVSAGGRDLLATSGDYLRLWHVRGPGSREVHVDCLLSNSKTKEHCAPLTSFDWNETDPSLIGTASIDTTCTIWDVNTGQAKTQLIAHDKEVYDITFARGKDVFGTVGADGSVRMFDLRSLEHSTILYESADLTPLLRLRWNLQDPNYLATITMGSNKTTILDVRVPSLPVAELQGHAAPVNGVAWAPHSASHICTAGEDELALIWDLSDLPRPVEDPILAYPAEGALNALSWSSARPDWLAVAFENKVQTLRV